MAAISIPILSLTIISRINNFNSIKIEFQGNSFFSTDYLMGYYRPLRNYTDIEKFIKKILVLYNDAGFPFCKIYPELKEKNGAEILLLQIEEGNRVIIKDYIFKTNKKTSIQALRRIARIKKDQYFSLSNLNYTKNLILKTNSFEEIKESIIKNGDDYYLYFEVREKSSDYLLAGGSIAQPTNYLFFEFSSLNILGTLRQLQFRYETSISGEMNKKDLKFNFFEPVVLNPVAFNTEFQICSYDSAHLSGLNINFNAPVNDWLSIILLSGFEMTNYRTGFVNYSYTRTILGTGLEFNMTTDDYIFISHIKFDYLLRSDERIRVFYDGTVKYSDFLIKPHYRFVKTESLEYFDYIRIGGASSVRGYMEDEFSLNQVFYINFEYKRLPVYPLLDIARWEKNFIYAYGIGIDVKTNFLNSSIALALPKKGTWNDCKIHILLEKNL